MILIERDALTHVYVGTVEYYYLSSKTLRGHYHCITACTSVARRGELLGLICYNGSRLYVGYVV